jgi:hypothetical protein
MKAKEFDEKFEAGEDMTNDLDFSKARRVNQEPERVNIDFPGDAHLPGDDFVW